MNPELTKTTEKRWQNVARKIHSGLLLASLPVSGYMVLDNQDYHDERRTSLHQFDTAHPPFIDEVKQDYYKDQGVTILYDRYGYITGGRTNLNQAPDPSLLQEVTILSYQENDRLEDRNKLEQEIFNRPTQLGPYEIPVPRVFGQLGVCFSTVFLGLTKLIDRASRNNKKIDKQATVEISSTQPMQ